MDLLVFTVGGITPLADALRPCLEQISRSLSGSGYGGKMENLWIEVELHEYGMNIPDRPPRPFRFQKRVSVPRSLTGVPSLEPQVNVGHYTVRPTFDQMRAASAAVAAQQVLDVVLDSTQCLAGKAPLRGFDVVRFRDDLAKVIDQFAPRDQKAVRAGG
jgi:hypothetical protein